MIVTVAWCVVLATAWVACIVVVEGVWAKLAAAIGLGGFCVIIGYAVSALWLRL